MERLLSNLTEVRTLAVLRDTLLPKLVSGELRVSLGLLAFMDLVDYVEDFVVPALLLPGVWPDLIDCGPDAHAWAVGWGPISEIALRRAGADRVLPSMEYLLRITR